MIKQPINLWTVHKPINTQLTNEQKQLVGLKKEERPKPADVLLLMELLTKCR